jgi:hypothetical protein
MILNQVYGSMLGFMLNLGVWCEEMLEKYGWVC